MQVEIHPIQSENAKLEFTDQSIEAGVNAALSDDYHLSEYYQPVQPALSTADQACLVACYYAKNVPEIVKSTLRDGMSFSSLKALRCLALPEEKKMPASQLKFASGSQTSHSSISTNASSHQIKSEDRRSAMIEDPVSWAGSSRVPKRLQKSQLLGTSTTAAINNFYLATIRFDSALQRQKLWLMQHSSVHQELVNPTRSGFRVSNKHQSEERLCNYGTYQPQRPKKIARQRKRTHIKHVPRLPSETEIVPEHSAIISSKQPTDKSDLSSIIQIAIEAPKTIMILNRGGGRLLISKKTRATKAKGKSKFFQKLLQLRRQTSKANVVVPQNVLAPDDRSTLQEAPPRRGDESQLALQNDQFKSGIYEFMTSHKFVKFQIKKMKKRTQLAVKLIESEAIQSESDETKCPACWVNLDRDDNFKGLTSNEISLRKLVSGDIRSGHFIKRQILPRPKKREVKITEKENAKRLDFLTAIQDEGQVSHQLHKELKGLWQREENHHWQEQLYMGLIEIEEDNCLCQFKQCDHLMGFQKCSSYFTCQLSDKFGRLFLLEQSLLASDDYDLGTSEVLDVYEQTPLLCYHQQKTATEINFKKRGIFFQQARDEKSFVLTQVFPLYLKCQETTSILVSLHNTCDDLEMLFNSFDIQVVKVIVNDSIRSQVKQILAKMRKKLKHLRSDSKRSILRKHLDPISPTTQSQLQQLPSLKIVIQSPNLKTGKKLEFIQPLELKALKRRVKTATKDYTKDFLGLKDNLIELREIVNEASAYTKKELVDSILTLSVEGTSSIDGLLKNLITLIYRKSKVIKNTLDHDVELSYFIAQLTNPKARSMIDSNLELKAANSYQVELSDGYVVTKSVDVKRAKILETAILKKRKSSKKVQIAFKVVKIMKVEAKPDVPPLPGIASVGQIEANEQGNQEEVV